jgi:hypothetical protein
MTPSLISEEPTAAGPAMSGALVRITIGGTGPAKYDVYDANDVDNHLLALNREHEQQLAALQADAERYRWLRKPLNDIPYSTDADGLRHLLAGSGLDAAIDAARASEGAPK